MINKPLFPARGRAASPHRPGFFIRRRLIELGQATISQLHAEYLDSLPKPPGRKRPKHGPNFSSWQRYFHHLERAGFIEKVVDESGKAISVPSSVHIMKEAKLYKITDRGASVTEPWGDFSRL